MLISFVQYWSLEMEAIDTAFLQRNCPSCGGSDAAQTINSHRQAEALSFDEVTSYWSGFFRDKIFFSYHRCTCGLLYCPEFFTQNQLSHLYASMADNTAGVSLAPLIKTQNGYFKHLAQYSKLKGGYLEFGPDIGLFTNNCIKKGDFDSYWLFEPNKEVWPVLEDALNKKTHRLFSDLQAMDEIPDQSISAVVMIHVLDHLIDPVQALKDIKRTLKPGAILLFVTHDEGSLLAKLAKRKWPPYCLQHPQLFNKNSMDFLLKNAGLTMLACKKTRNYFPVTYLMKHFLYLFGFKNVKLPELNKIQVGLKLGNIVTIATIN